MNPATPYIKNVSKIKKDIPKIAEDYIKANSKRILDLVRVGQLGKGVDSKGNDLVYPGKTSNIPLYEPSTQNFWANQSPRPRKPKKAGSRYNFEWTGGTFDKMTLDLVSDSNIKIFTLDGKKALLEATYGNIFSLNEQHNDLINEWLLNHLYKYLFDNLLHV